MKKIISTLIVGFVLCGCDTIPTTDTETPKNNDSAQQSAPQDQQTLAEQQMAAFQANQIRLNTQPVNN